MYLATLLVSTIDYPNGYLRVSRSVQSTYGQLINEHNALFVGRVAVGAFDEIVDPIEVDPPSADLDRPEVRQGAVPFEADR